MKTFLLLLILLSLPVVDALSQNMEKISAKIYEKQVKEFKIKRGTYEFNDLQLAKYDRDKSKWYSYLKISPISDTVYINQRIDSQGYSSISAWNSQGIIYLSHFFNREFEVVEKEELIEKDLRLIDLCTFISRWDKKEISDCDKIDRTNPIVLPPLMNYATRIVFNQKKYYIDCVKFLDCF